MGSPLSSLQFLCQQSWSGKIPVRWSHLSWIQTSMWSPLRPEVSRPFFVTIMIWLGTDLSHHLVGAAKNSLSGDFLAVTRPKLDRATSACGFSLETFASNSILSPFRESLSSQIVRLPRSLRR